VTTNQSNKTSKSQIYRQKKGIIIGATNDRDEMSEMQSVTSVNNYGTTEDYEQMRKSRVTICDFEIERTN